jgi:hypothetical protein
MTTGQKYDTLGWLKAVYDLSAATADPDREFYYLGGPMTDKPQYNFPEFDRIAGNLRGADYNIVSPAELDSPHDRAAALASPDGRDTKVMDKAWEDFLMRDVVICAMPTCKGGIFMGGWEDSSGAALESYVLTRLKKPVYRYYDTPDGCGFVLVEMDRDAELANRTADIRKSIEEVR